MTTEGRFSGVFRLLSTSRRPVPVLLVIAVATVFLAPLVLKPCQFCAGSALRCRAATALLLGLPCLNPAEQLHLIHGPTQCWVVHTAAALGEQTWLSTKY